MKSIISRFLAPQRDPVDDQLHQLSKQGAGMARAAHWCATLLVVLFSAGSLVALGSDALRSVLHSWQAYHTIDVPSTITLAVSTLMVLAMDCAMLAAASMLRLLASRRAGWNERLVHVAVMAVVAALESGTYWFMSWQYEHPTSTAAGALIIARALAAPLLAVYLAMTRVLPVTSRDVLAMAELAAGAGVLRDITAAARDSGASLHRKMQLYGSAAVMAPHDRTRLDNMVKAVQTPDGPAFTGLMIPAASGGASESHPGTLYDGSQSARLLTGPNTRLLQLEPPESALGEPDRPPTGPGSPTVAPRPQPVRTTPEKTPAPRTIKLVPDTRPKRVAARGRAHPKQSVEAKVRAAYVPGMSVGELERASGVSRSSANRWRIVLERELAGRSGEVAQ